MTWHENHTNIGVTNKQGKSKDRRRWMKWMCKRI